MQDGILVRPRGSNQRMHNTTRFYNYHADPCHSRWHRHRISTSYRAEQEQEPTMIKLRCGNILKISIQGEPMWTNTHVSAKQG